MAGGDVVACAALRVGLRDAAAPPDAATGDAVLRRRCTSGLDTVGFPTIGLTIGDRAVRRKGKQSCLVVAVVVRFRQVRTLAGFWVLLVLGGCGQEPASRDSGLGPVRGAAIPSAVSALPSECLRNVESIAALNRGVPGAESSAGRAELLTRAKATPVIFVREPKASADATATAIRRSIEGAAEPVLALSREIGKLRANHGLAREVLLSEGYLYFTHPQLASAVVRWFSLEDLFDEQELEIWRGARRLRVVRDRWGYVVADSQGGEERAELVLFDRVRPAGSEEAKPLHRDLGALASERGFNEMEVLGIDGDRLAARLRYGSHWTQAVISLAEVAGRLECEAVQEQQLAQVEAVRLESRRRNAALKPVLDAVHRLVLEGLPFDEPRTEEGQQDGKLRQSWHSAYLNGAADYEFNGDRYVVFDPMGRPRPPEVCIDFVLDAFERAAGTWWLGRSEGRGRRVGRLDFSNCGIDNRRSVRAFIDFSWSRPTWFDVYMMDEIERVPLRDERLFFARLYEQRFRYQPGDIVAIEGLRSDGKRHFHSFIVMETDPVTAMPIRVAANAGRPRVRSWESEMLSAPRRSIFARVRPTTGWLEAVMLGVGALPPVDESVADPSPEGGRAL
jgi:hypothetical protein